MLINVESMPLTLTLPIHIFETHLYIYALHVWESINIVSLLYQMYFNI